MPRGGYRPNAGKEKGSKNKSTLAFEERRTASLNVLRDMVMAELGPMTQAQIAHAKGIGYMLLRRDDGTYARATDVKQVDAALAAGESMFELFTQAPNV